MYTHVRIFQYLHATKSDSSTVLEIHTEGVSVSTKYLYRLLNFIT